MSAMLAFPGTALAATYVEVDGQGHNAGTAVSGNGWSWDGADDMVLDGYDGGAIYAEGKLNVELKGENKVSSDINNADPDASTGAMGDAIGVYEAEEYDDDTDEWNVVEEAELNITGDGTLNVEGKEGWGVYVSGDLSIDGTTVDVSVSGAGSASGIDAENLTISNSQVSVTTKAEAPESDPNDTTTAITAETGVYVWDGNISVENSKLTVEGSNADFGSGIYAASSGDNIPAPVITFKSSDVSVSGYADYAIASIFHHPANAGDTLDTATAKQGKIIIEDSQITLPKGGKVQDMLIWEGWDATASGPGEWLYGQTIGTGDTMITGSDEAAKTVAITSNATLKSELPATGDATSAATLFGAGIAAAGAVAYSRRKMAEE